MEGGGEDLELDEMEKGEHGNWEENETKNEVI